MNIGIDIRSLLDPHPSGVGEYTREILEALFRIDQENHYHLFANAADTSHIPNFNYPNVNTHLFHYPNKLLNLSMRFFNFPKIDALISKHYALDLFFFPNINFAALDKKIPAITTVHDLSYHLVPSFYSLKQRIWHYLVKPKKHLCKSSAIISASNHTCKDLQKHFKIAKELITPIHNGINNNFFQETNGFELQQIKIKYNLPEKFILFVGDQNERKNITTIIEAFDLLKEKDEFKDLHLVMVGKQNKGYPLPTTNYQLQTSYVPREDRRALYTLAQAFIYPSYYEGFGLPPLEAMACGTPVIASHTSSLGEILGNSALLIDPYNVKDLYRALEQLLTDSTLRAKLRQRGRIQALKYTWDRAARETLAVFKVVKK